METQLININQIDQNKGQIAGLPANPRQWTRDDVERLARSIDETPELLDARPLITIPHGGKYIVLGGNLRLAALKKLGRKEAPVYALPEDTPPDKLREIVVKDNGAFGSWDFDMLANEWDDLPLLDWGVPAWDVEQEVEKVEKDEEKIGRVPFSEVLGEEHNYIVLYFDNDVDWLQAQTVFGVQPVKALPTRRGGTQSLAFQKRIGVGRVINGAKAINRLLDNKGEGK